MIVPNKVRADRNKKIVEGLEAGGAEEVTQRQYHQIVRISDAPQGVTDRMVKLMLTKHDGCNFTNRLAPVFYHPRSTEGCLNLHR